MRKYSLLSGAAVGTVLAIAVWTWRGLPRRELPSRPASHSASEAAPLPLWVLSPGTLLHYQVRDIGQLGGTNVKLTGKVRIAIVAVQADGYLAHVQWASVDELQDAAGRLQPLLAALQRGAMITLANRGFQPALIDAPALLPDAADWAPLVAPGATRAFWETLLATWQMPLPEATAALSPSGEFSRDEVLHGDVLRVRYALSAATDAPMRVSKVWSGLRPSERQIHGTAAGVFRPRWQGLASLLWSGDELLGQAPHQLQAHSEVAVRWLAQEMVDAAQLKRQLLSALPLTSLSPLEPSLAIDQAVVKDLDEGQLLALLRQQGSDGELSQDFYLKLKSWLSLHPESIAAVIQLLTPLNAEDARLRSLIKALVAIGSPRAQAALTEVLAQSAGSPQVQARVVASLGFVEHPTPATVRSVMALANSAAEARTAQKATYAAGILGNRLLASSDTAAREQGQSLEEQLAALLQRATTDSARYDAMAALGNLGPSNPAVLAPYHQSPSPKLCAQSYFALRFARPPEVSGQLAAAFQAEHGDGAATVRGEILRAFALRPVDAPWFSAVATLSGGHLATGEALALGQAVVKAAPFNPAASREILTRLLGATADEGARRALQGYQNELMSHH